MAFVLILHFTGHSAIALLAGVFSGLGTMGCGLQVFRVARIHDRTREVMAEKPDFMKGVAVATLGLLIVAAAIGLS